MDPKHIMKALAIAYLQEHGDKVEMTKQRLLELMHDGNITIRGAHDDRVWFISLE